MSTATIDTALFAHTREQARLSRAARHELLVDVAELEVTGAAMAAGYPSTERLLVDLLHVDQRIAKRLVLDSSQLVPRRSFLGEWLAPRMPATAAASAEGAVSAEHVHAVVEAMRAIEGLPDVTPTQVAEAETALAAAARTLAPKAVERVGQRLLAHLDQDGAAPTEDPEPRSELRVMRRRRDQALRMVAVIHGGADAGLVLEVLDALSAPAGPDDPRSLAQRMAEAFLELCAIAASPHGIAHDELHGDDTDDTDGDADEADQADQADQADDEADDQADDEADDEDDDAADDDEDEQFDDADDPDAEELGDDETDDDADDELADEDNADDELADDELSDPAGRDAWPGRTDGDAANSDGLAGRGKDRDDADDQDTLTDAADDDARTEADDDGSDPAGPDADHADDAGDAAAGGRSGRERTRRRRRKRDRARKRQCPGVQVSGRALLAVTIDQQWLAQQVGHATLDSGQPLDPASARRLACDAGVVPIVLGSRGEPLDVGRLSYTIPAGMRRALHHRDRGCTFPGCTRRPKRCHAHHIKHWVDGGPTALDNCCLLCRYHHHLVHHDQWHIQMRQGRPWFIPPAFIDPHRRPLPGGPHPLDL